MQKTQWLIGAAVVGFLFIGQTKASAQDRNMVVDMEAGGGISDFTGAAASNLTKLGATWDVRAGVYLQIPVKLEVAYEGSTHPTNEKLAPFVPGGPSIRSNGLNALALWEPPFRLRVIHPFVFGGFGWDHWSLSGGGINDPTAIKGSDDTAVFPFGGGLRVPLLAKWELDSRFTYRATILDDLLQTNSLGQPDAGSKSSTTWTATARVGYIF